jgi:mono/diheme cytochrome c family protein
VLRCFAICLPTFYELCASLMKYPITIMTILSIVWSMAANAQNDLAQVEPVKAKEIYDQMCAGCHGYRGDGGEGHRGGFSPHIGTLANKEYMASVPDDYLLMIIKKGGAYMGKIATMPAWEKRLSEEEILAIVAHIRTF